MLKSNEDIKKVIYNFILSYIGIILLIFMLVEPFEYFCYSCGYCKLTAIWSTPSTAVFAAFVTAFFSATELFGKKKPYVILGVTLAVLLFVVINRFEIAYGSAMYYNAVVEKMAMKYGSDLWFADCTETIRNGARVAMTVNIFLIFAAMAFTGSISSGRLLSIPFITVFSAYAITWLTAEELSGIMISFPVGYMVLLLCLMFSLKRKKLKIDSIKAGKLSIAISLAVTVALLISTTVRPYENYSRLSIYDSVSDLFTGIGGVSKTKSYDGRIGQDKSRSYTGETDLYAYMPKISKRAYVVGYVADSYENSTWNESKDYSNPIYNVLNDLNVNIGKYKGCKIEKAGQTEGPEFKFSYFDETQNRSFFTDLNSIESLELLIYINDRYTGQYSPDVTERAQKECMGKMKNEKDWQKIWDECEDVNVRVSLQNPKRENILVILQYVKNYLAENYQYTLSPGKVPKGKDAINYFMFENKKGYCTYFASAATMLLRQAGIPARYVEGYSFVTGELKGEETGYQYNDMEFTFGEAEYKFEVPDSCAHAWVQVYFEDIGWINFDPTPAANIGSQPTSEDETTEPATTTAQETTGEQMTTGEEKTTLEAVSSGTNETTVSPETVETTEKSEKTVNKIVIFIVAILGIILLCVFISYIRYILLSNRKKRIYNNEDGNTADNIKWIYSHYVKIFELGELHHRHYMTEQQYAEAIMEKFDCITEEDVLSMVDIIEKTLYSNTEANGEDLINARSIVERLVKNIDSEVGLFTRIIHKYYHVL